MDNLNHLDGLEKQAGAFLQQLSAFREDANLKSILQQLRGVLVETGQYLMELDMPEQAGTAYRMAQKLLGYPARHGDYDLLCRAVSYFFGQLHSLRPGRLGRTMNLVRMGYFPTDPDHTALIRQAVAFPDETVNLLDPCCGEGLALEALAAGQNARTYGIELDEARAEEATGRLSRVGIGSYFLSDISTGCFHLLFLNPPYLQAGERRLERAFLADSIRHLMTGGLLVYIIPYHRATEEVCRILADNFDQIRVHRFLPEEFSKWKQIAFTGVKRPRRKDAETAEALLSLTFRPDRIPLITELPAGAYTLPKQKKPVSRFHGSVFNTLELAEQMRQSRAIEDMFCRPSEDKERRPLLPLNLSQIGLIGASGLLDGLMDGDTPHVVKGSILRTISSSLAYEDDDYVQEKEIRSNKLIFNVLAADGFHSLQ